MTYHGKRSIRRTQAGNIHGYVGRKYYRYLGQSFFEPDESFAENWKAGLIPLDGNDNEHS